MSSIMGVRSLPFVLLCVAVAGASPAMEQSGTARLVVARTVGYVIGDLVPYAAVITVDHSWTLRRASLPNPGNPEYWLELRSVDVDEKRVAAQRVYTVRLLYQVFYAPIEARARKLPGFAVEFDHRGMRSPIDVPPLTITLSPLREVVTGTGDPEQNVTPAPDRAATSLPLLPPLLGVGLSAVLASGMFLLIAWQRLTWPFARRTGPPFAVAERSLRKLVSEDPQSNAIALRTLHRAFDAAAGWRVFADDVPRFLAQQPRFTGAAAEIHGFFAASRSQFFADPGANAAAMPPATVEVRSASLRDLAHRLAAIERGA